MVPGEPTGRSFPSPDRVRVHSLHFPDVGFYLAYGYPDPVNDPQGSSVSRSSFLPVRHEAPPRNLQHPPSDFKTLSHEDVGGSDPHPSLPSRQQQHQHYP